MRIEFQNSDKVNLEFLKAELGVDFKVVREPYTESLDDGIAYYGYIIEINDAVVAAHASKDFSSIAAAHAPEFSTREEEEKARQSVKTLYFKDIFLQLLTDKDVEAAIKKLLV